MILAAEFESFIHPFTVLLSVPLGVFAYSPDGAIVQIHGVGPFDIQWRDGVATLGDSTQHHRFQYRIGDRVKIPQGTGEIQRGYASGNLIQYEVLLDDGELRMVLESELQLAR